MRIVITLSLLLSLSLASMAQFEKIHWMSMQEALDANKENPKKIIVDMYTDWCGWCKRMDATTFGNPDIAAYINKNYYAVKFDAEGQDTITWNGKIYTNTPMVNSLSTKKPTHSLARVLSQGRLSYPTLIFLDDSSQLIAPIPGYRTAQDLQPILIYFTENLHKYTDLQQFLNDFKATFIEPDSSKKDLEYMPIQKAMDNVGKTGKKYMLFFYSDWCTTCKIMEETTFKDSTIREFVSQNFVPVKFNATDTSTISLNGVEFKNQNNGHPFHDFAVSILNGKMQFPNVILLSEDFKIITQLPNYYSANGFEPIIEYFGQDVYLSKQWNDFLKERTLQSN